MHQLVAALAQALGDNPHLPLMLVREQMSGAHRLAPEVRDAFFGFFRLTRTILEQGARSGRLRPADPHAVHLCMVGSLVYFLMTAQARANHVAQGALPTSEPGWDEHVAEVQEILHLGLKSRAKTNRKKQKRRAR